MQCHSRARILIAGQAPGRKAHEAGQLFADASGERLRDWLGISSAVFYDATKVAILPMGFCYPGTGKSGDLPPRSECAPAWRGQLVSRMREVRLTLVVGQYAQAAHFGSGAPSLTDLVKAWRDYWPAVIPLPHPSPRNELWLRKHPWFEQDLLPELKRRTAEVLR